MKEGEGGGGMMKAEVSDDVIKQIWDRRQLKKATKPEDTYIITGRDNQQEQL